jgi:hypothetical protein
VTLPIDLQQFKQHDLLSPVGSGALAGTQTLNSDIEAPLKQYSETKSPAIENGIALVNTAEREEQSPDIDVNNVNLATFPDIKKETEATSNLVFRFDKAVLKHNPSKSHLQKDGATQPPSPN